MGQLFTKIASAFQGLSVVWLKIHKKNRAGSGGRGKAILPSPVDCLTYFYPCCLKLSSKFIFEVLSGLKLPTDPKTRFPLPLRTFTCDMRSQLTDADISNINSGNWVAEYSLTIMAIWLTG